MPNQILILIPGVMSPDSATLCYMQNAQLFLVSIHTSQTAHTHITILECGFCGSMYLAENTATVVKMITQQTTRQLGSQPNKKERIKGRVGGS